MTNHPFPLTSCDICVTALQHIHHACKHVHKNKDTFRPHRRFLLIAASMLLSAFVVQVVLQSFIILNT